MNPTPTANETQNRPPESGLWVDLNLTKERKNELSVH
jgi:hypothetical protein